MCCFNSKEIDLPSALKARLNVKLRPSAAILSAVQEHLAGSIQLKFDTFLQVTCAAIINGVSVCVCVCHIVSLYLCVYALDTCRISILSSH
jgi:hypothetical protein